MKKYVNGQYIEMTAEEVTEWKRIMANAPTPEPTAEERLAALETRMEQADIDRAALIYLLTGEES